MQKLIKAVLQLADIRVRTSVLIFRDTVTRKGELAALEWKDMDFESHTMTLIPFVQLCWKTCATFRGHCKNTLSLGFEIQ